MQAGNAGKCQTAWHRGQSEPARSTSQRMDKWCPHKSGLHIDTQKRAVRTWKESWVRCSVCVCVCTESKFGAGLVDPLSLCPSARAERRVHQILHCFLVGDVQTWLLTGGAVDLQSA